MNKSSRVPCLAVVILSFFGSLSGAAARQAPAVPQPPRDVVRREPTGTGVIKGQVVAADSGNPIRRADVNLVFVPPPAPPAPPGGGPPAIGAATVVPASPGSGAPQASASMLRPRQAITNAQGAFEFTGLPAGSYRIMVSTNQYAPQYLSMAYGAKKPSGPGSSDFGQLIHLADGQSFDKALIALPRGGVITGRVTDENGEPVVRVQVSTLFFAPGSSRGTRMGPGSQTDDLGLFRIYGLQAGDHAVVAEALRFNFVPPNAPPEKEEDRVGFVTTYFPGTADEGAAQRVRARVGAETSGIEIRLAQGRMYRVAGSVVDSQGQPLTQVNGQLMRRAAGPGGGYSSFGFSTDERGQFQMRNVPSGAYRLVVQRTRPYLPGPSAQSDPGEMANVPLTIAGADLENVLVMTTPGVTITGQVVMEQPPAAGTSGQTRVMVSPGEPNDMMGLQWPQPAMVKPDSTFTLKGLLGEFLLRATAPNQYLKSVMVGNEEVTDTPREFTPNDRVVITLTSRASTLEGNVSDAAGEPSAEAGVIIFSEDKDTWRFNSTRTRRTGADPNGHFRMNGLMPGRYFVAVVPRERLNVPPGAVDISFFEELSKDATSVVLAEDEQRRVDLRLPIGSRTQ